MRWVTYASPAGGERTGLVVDDTVHGLEPGTTMQDLLDAQDGLSAAGDRARQAPAEVVALNDVTLRAPLQPRSIRDCTGFLQHLRNCAGGGDFTVGERYTQVPAFYFSNTAAVVGPYDDVAISPGSEKFDYELEVCAIIGTAGSDIAREDAEAHIAGYSILCDWSARDLQITEMSMGLGPAKGKDSANTLGPMLVTPDEIETHRDGKGFALAMTGFVNDELVSSGNWNEIDWDFADMITYTSRGTRLLPGDVIGSGTVPTGCLFEHSAMRPDTFRGWLQPGDQVRLAVEGIGEISQRVVAGATPRPLSTGH